MELILFGLYTAAKILLNIIIIILLAGFTGFGLSIGYCLGKGLIGKIASRIQKTKTEEKHKTIIDEFTAVEQP